MAGRSPKLVPPRLHERWLSPTRHGLRLLLSPVEYRHLRGFALARTVGAALAASAGIACLAYYAYGWGSFFFVVAALNAAAGRS